VNGIRFVALGDSITVGLGDPMPGHKWRGWAGLLAESIGEPGQVEYHNLARLGAQSHTLVERQLPQALALRPHVASVIVGVNDTLRGSFSIHRTGAALNHAIRELRASGAIVLTCRLPDPGRMFRLPEGLARQFARRMGAINTLAETIAAKHDTVHFDPMTRPDIYDRLMWSVDRLHPSERGHRMLARNFALRLAERGVPVHTVPGEEPLNKPPSRVATTLWMATQGTAWLIRRSTDLLPNLFAMSAMEWWRDLRGRVSRMDQRVTAEVHRTIGTLGLDASTLGLDHLSLDLGLDGPAGALTAD
jgi:lysophospholipase L1-like esterase